MQRLVRPLSFLQSVTYRPTPTVYSKRFLYCRNMSSDLAVPVGTHKDPVTGEMISKQ